MEKKVTSHIVKGLIISLILILISVISNLTGNERSSWVTWASNIILFGGIVWACISYGNQMNHEVTYGNVFAHGFKTSAVITVITIAFTIIFLLAFPDIKEKALEIARQEMDKQSQLTDDQKDTAMEITRKFFLPITIGAILLMYLIVGLIASLIGAALTKRNPQSPFANPVR